MEVEIHTGTSLIQWIFSQILCDGDVLNTEDISLNKIEMCELRDFILVG